MERLLIADEISLNTNEVSFRFSNEDSISFEINQVGQKVFTFVIPRGSVKGLKHPWAQNNPNWGFVNLEIKEHQITVCFFEGAIESEFETLVKSREKPLRVRKLYSKWKSILAKSNGMYKLVLEDIEIRVVKRRNNEFRKTGNRPIYQCQ